MKTYSLTIDGVEYCCGPIHVPEPLQSTPLAPLNWGGSFTAEIRLTRSEVRRLRELGNPGIKAWNFWAQVKLNQERRRLARRKRR